jgi:hypothetical protein
MLLGTAGCWFLLDYAYYGNTISTPQIIKLISPTASTMSTIAIQLASHAGPARAVGPEPGGDLRRRADGRGAAARRGGRAREAGQGLRQRAVARGLTMITKTGQPESPPALEVRARN